MKSILKNQYLEFNFILFPFWIGCFYILLNSLFPDYKYLLFFLFLFVFGETHFASTYLFYFDKRNHSWILKNYLKMIVFPIILLAAFIFIGFNSIYLAVLIISVASAFHVTRQSVGISRLYSNPKNSFYEYSIYFFSFLFIFIGFVRFVLNDLIDILNLPFNNLIFDKSYFYPLIFLGIIIGLSNRDNYKKMFSTLCGILVYSPYVFLSNPFDAMVVGVGAHWCQYLALNYKIYFSKQTNYSYIVIIAFFIILYSLLMTYFGFELYTLNDYSNLLVLIPLTGNMFHFYTDMYIWKFSDPHVRENIGKKIYT